MAPPARRPKLLFVVTEDWYFVSHRMSLGRAAVAAGYEVIVASRVQGQRAHLEGAGIGVAPLGWRRRGFAPWREMRALIALARLYRRERPDILHHVALKPVVYGSLAALVCPEARIVNAIAGLGFVFSSSRASARVRRPILKLALARLLGRPRSRTLVQNPDDVRAVVGLGVPPGRITRIPGGIDETHFQVLPEPPGMPIVVTMVSRLLRDKGVEELVEAARLLAGRDLPVRVLLVGGPDPDNPATLTAAELEGWTTAGIVSWVGHREDVRAIWAESHIAVLPSYREGLPRALLEAAACARPLVATDVPGCREIVRHEDTGLLVPPRDSAALADAIARLVGDGALRRRMGERARALVEAEFTESAGIARTLSMYRELLADG